jgi:hypothetical protein
MAKLRLGTNNLSQEPLSVIEITKTVSGETLSIGRTKIHLCRHLILVLLSISTYTNFISVFRQFVFAQRKKFHHSSKTQPLKTK